MCGGPDFAACFHSTFSCKVPAPCPWKCLEMRGVMGPDKPLASLRQDMLPSGRSSKPQPVFLGLSLRDPQPEVLGSASGAPNLGSWASASGVPSQGSWAQPWGPQPGFLGLSLGVLSQSSWAHPLGSCLLQHTILIWFCLSL